MASSPTRQIQAKGAKPEDHVNDFLDFISQFCAKKGYQGLRDLSQENEDLKTKLKQAEVDCQDRRDAFISVIENEASEWKRKFDKSESGCQLELKEMARLTEVEKAQDKIKKQRDDAISKHNSLEKDMKAKHEALLKSANERKSLEESLKALRSYCTNLSTHEDMQSNTLAAKQMRVAAGLAVLATALQRQIFQPLYLGADSNEFVVFLESFREMDPQHELYLRSVLLKSHLEKQKEFGRIRAKNAAMEAMLMLQMLIPSDKLVDCMAEVTRICEDALKQWMPLQKIKQQVVANMRFEKPSEMGLALDLPVAARAPDSAKANKQRVGSKSQAGQASSTQPEDEDSSSDEEDVYGV
ncbi:hypothetical protein S40288_11603 [Stachybotrys chartarum IBT 40288]|nr:hypothetical protein S40288_11603 [Stachybotrys chartarum IBT 40288]